MAIHYKNYVFGIGNDDVEARRNNSHHVHEIMKLVNEVAWANCTKDFHSSLDKLIARHRAESTHPNVRK